MYVYCILCYVRYIHSAKQVRLHTQRSRDLRLSAADKSHSADEVRSLKAYRVNHSLGDHHVVIRILRRFKHSASVADYSANSSPDESSHSHHRSPHCITITQNRNGNNINDFIWNGLNTTEEIITFLLTLLTSRSCRCKVFVGNITILIIKWSIFSI